MAHVLGTVSNHYELSDYLRDFCTNRTVLTVAVNAGGSNYTVGDILQLNSGTALNSMVATVEVISVSAGAVTGLRLVQSGSFATGNEPTVTGGATSNISVANGAASGCTVDTTNGDVGWQIRRDARNFTVEDGATIVEVTAGGSDYAVNDIIALDSTGDADITVNPAVGEATFRVTAVNAGAVTAVEVVTGGGYSESDGGAGGVATTNVTVGNPAATGCTLDPFFYGVDGIEGSNPDPINQEREVILEGSGSGSDQIFVGWNSYQTESGANRSFELHGYTGFTPQLDRSDQPGVSPGFFDDQTVGGGAFVPLQNASLNFWFFVNARRIIVVVRAGTVYANFHMGFLDPFQTAGEFPYPLMISGCASNEDRNINDGEIDISGLTDPIADTTSDNGPMFMRQPDGVWEDFINSGASGTSQRSALHNQVVTPCGEPGGTGTSHIVDDADDWFSSIHRWQQIIPNSGIPGNPSRVLSVAEDGGDGLPVLYPCTLVDGTSTPQIWGEINNVFWVSKFGTTPSLQPEDEIVINNEVYLVFQNGNRTDNWASFCIKQE